MGLKTWWVMIGCERQQKDVRLIMSQYFQSLFTSNRSESQFPENFYRNPDKSITNIQENEQTNQIEPIDFEQLRNSASPTADNIRSNTKSSTLSKYDDLLNSETSSSPVSPILDQSKISVNLFEISNGNLFNSLLL